MKLGISTYCLLNAINAGEMDVLDVIDWAAKAGCEHVEIVPLGYDLHADATLAKRIVKKAADAGIALSNYAVKGNFILDGEEAFRSEIERLKEEVRMAASLGVTKMRHDIASHEDTSLHHFRSRFDRLVEGCRAVAEYAEGFGITTSIENHGYFVQASDRVLSIIDAVDRTNFRTTLDVGNFVCVDEEPLASVRKNVPFASMVHLKDFYIRAESRNPGEGWFRSATGRYLRGAIVGQGDLPIPEIIAAVKGANYDGFISIEFEGMEPCMTGTRIALGNARRLWDEVQPN